MSYAGSASESQFKSVLGSKARSDQMITETYDISLRMSGLDFLRKSHDFTCEMLLNAIYFACVRVMQWRT